MTETAAAPIIALAGSPNCGKSALFNALTGSRQKVANYPGVTVEKKVGHFFSESGRQFQVIDLPGFYSLEPRSPDEQVARDLILNRLEKEKEYPDVLVVVVDATQLKRHLGLVLELKRIGKPIVVALNMMDLAQSQRVKINSTRLEEELGIPVVETVATSGKGLKLLEKKVHQLTESLSVSKRDEIPWQKESIQEIEERFHRVDELIRDTFLEEGSGETFTERLDKVLLHPFWGWMVLAFVMVTMFQAVFAWAGPLQDWVDSAFIGIGSLAQSVLPEGPLRSLVVDGMIAGVGGVVIFLPQILLLFLFILILEDLGYMSRAAFLLDRVMGRVGLHGRSFVPLLSSFACSIPGIMATRTIENRKDRLVTMMVAPLMTCSAQIPVYTLLVGAFIPDLAVFGPLRLQGLVLLSLYVLGVVFALIFAALAKKTVLRGDQAALVLEMPSYKWPSWRNVVHGLVQRAGIFLRRAGTIILGLSMVLWFLASYPKSIEVVNGQTVSQSPAMTESYAGQMGRAIEPLLKPIGFDWKIGMALIPGFAAREVMVSGLATVYAVDSESDALEQKLGARLFQDWSLATALALLVWYIFAPQCVSTFAVIRRETNSWKWTGFIFGYLLIAAYLFTFLFYRLFLSLGLG